METKKLYRFRRCQNIPNLLKFQIDGSKYSTMNDKKEVDLKIDVEKVKQVTSIGEDVIFKTKEIIRNHIIDSYFLSCFTTVDQTNDKKMWEDYADNNGFCLVYNPINVKNAIKSSMIKNKNRFYLFREVDYGSEPTDITDFLVSYFGFIKNDVDNEETFKKAANYVSVNLSNETKKRITNCMFHKIGSFPEKNEIRIVLMGTKTDKKYCDSMLLENVRPIEIICSQYMVSTKKEQLEKFAKLNKIKFCVKNY